MLDINFIRKNKKLVQAGVQNKGRQVDIDELLKIDRERRTLSARIENLRSQVNKLSKTKPSAQEIIRLKKLKQILRELEPSLKKLTKNFQHLMFLIPNLPASDVRVGKDESENQSIKKWGKPTKFNFQPRDHIQLGKINQMIDIERAAKVSGSRFYYLTGRAVELEFALVNFVFDKLIKRGFQPVIPPHIISERAMRGMGYLEHGEDKEIYFLPKDNQYLIGTSEQAIGAMHMDEILPQEKLPLRYTAFSPCYRREAGSYGKDTKGILRAHQFDKIEMFSFALPEKSDQEHQMFLSIEEEIMQELVLPYQVIDICSGDLGDPAAKKFDIEAWMPGQGRYRETHSTSNTTDFQARRLNIRYRNSQSKKTQFVHMVNGTAIAIGRILIAIMENYQTKDGKIEIPKVLKKYMRDSSEDFTG